MLQISEITTDKIKNNELTQELSEFYELKNLVEHNRNHNHDIVFEHSLNTARAMRKQIATAPKTVQSLLNQPVETHTRKELLELTALLHDIGKLTTKKQEGEKISFPGHEVTGAKIILDILERTDLPKAEQQWVARLIRHHIILHELSDSKKNIEERFEKIKREFSDIIVELILLVIADIKGAHMRVNRPDDYNFRINFFEGLLKNWS